LLTRAYSDVSGWVDQTSSTKGEGDADPKAISNCANEQTVFDPKANAFWIGNGLRPALVPLTSNNGETMKPNSIELPSEIRDWVNFVLRGASASGSKTQKFGYQTAKFTWSFVRE
jgi:hypothetical protein